MVGSADTEVRPLGSHMSPQLSLPWCSLHLRQTLPISTERSPLTANSRLTAHRFVKKIQRFLYKSVKNPWLAEILPILTGPGYQKDAELCEGGAQSCNRVSLRIQMSHGSREARKKEDWVRCKTIKPQL